MSFTVKRAIRRIRLLYYKYFGSQSVYARLRIQPFIDRGLMIGTNVNIFDTYIDPLYPFLIRIGDNVTITSSALIAHDASMKNALGKTLLGRINIKNNVFIGHGSIILPDTSIGSNVVVGAGSVVSRDIPDNCVVVGNARIIHSHDYYLTKMKNLMQTRPVYNYALNKIDAKVSSKMLAELENGPGFND